MGKTEKKYTLETILFEIYRMKVLSIDQLNKVVFDNSAYGKRYLKEIESLGYVGGKILSKERKRIGKVYFCTEKGMDYLEDRGFIRKYGSEIKIKTEETGKQYEVMTESGKYVPLRVNATTNMPTKEQMSMVYHTNNLYAALMPYGMHYYDSREWKIMHSMNRNTMVRGGIEMLDGRFYAVYALFSSNELSNAKLKESMLNRIVNEMQETPTIQNYIIFCYNKEIYDTVYEYFFNNLAIHAAELLLVPVNGTLEYGIEQLKLYRHEMEHKKDVESILNARLYGKDELQKVQARIMADWLVDIDGKKHYVIDTLKLDIQKLIGLHRYYHKDRYVADGTPVAILYWHPGVMSNFIQDIAKHRDYIKLIPVSAQEKIKYIDGNQEVLGEWTKELTITKIQNPTFK